MRKNKILLYLFTIILASVACTKELDVKDLNNPSPENAKTETGLVSLAQGGIYVNGFYDLKYTDGVYGRFWSS
jgi:starch-binding outer membrane protein, SusD/RagB family